MVLRFMRISYGHIIEVFERTLSDPPGTVPYRVHVDASFYSSASSLSDALADVSVFVDLLNSLNSGGAF